METKGSDKRKCNLTIDNFDQATHDAMCKKKICLVVLCRERERESEESSRLMYEMRKCMV